MTNKERALVVISQKPGLNALQVAEILGAKHPHTLKIKELEDEGKIRWDEGQGGWVRIE